MNIISRVTNSSSGDFPHLLHPSMPYNQNFSSASLQQIHCSLLNVIQAKILASIPIFQQKMKLFFLLPINSKFAPASIRLQVFIQFNSKKFHSCLHCQSQFSLPVSNESSSGKIEIKIFVRKFHQS